MVTTNFSMGWAATYNPETVTLKIKTAEGVYTPPEGVTVPFAARSMATLDDIDSLDREAVAFDLWKAKLAGNVPKPNDEVLDATGKTWQIKTLEVCDHGERYHCNCLELQQ